MVEKSAELKTCTGAVLTEEATTNVPSNVLLVSMGTEHGQNQ